ncbi:MAG: SDR family oxidoreductase [Cyanobacteria bacterium]|nr:SDR family oxidoreductase [Cyanobacteriota bacterium]
MANYLVTGGAGFIGSHISEALVKRGHRVRAADNFVTGYRQNIRDGVEFLEGDCADPAFAKQIVAGMDYVVHQAAIPSVPRSVEKPLESHRANVDGMLQMLLASRDAGVKRLVFAGSSSVYGDTEVLPKTETMPTNPMTPYALQKLMSEQYGQMFTRLYGFETVTTRYFNVFGPRQDPGSPYSGVISLFIKALHEGRRPTIYGDGGQTRDFTYVTNVVDGVIRAAETPGVGGHVFNVATNSRISLNQLLATLNKIFGTTLDAIYKEARQGDVRDSQADISKAEKLLGYQPIVGLEEGLRETVKWFKAS